MPESIRRAEPSLGNLSKIKTAPITGVHFWFDRVVMDEPFVTLLDTNTQWIFNKSQLYGQSSGDATSGAISADGHQRFLRPAEKIAPGNYRSLSAGSSPGLAARARSAIDEGHGDQRSRRHFFSATRRGPLAAKTTNQSRRACSSPAIGPRPAGPPPWKAPSAAAIWPRKLRCWRRERHRNFCSPTWPLAGWFRLWVGKRYD